MDAFHADIRQSLICDYPNELKGRQTETQHAKNREILWVPVGAGQHKILSSPFNTNNANRKSPSCPANLPTYILMSS